MNQLHEAGDQRAAVGGGRWGSCSLNRACARELECPHTGARSPWQCRAANGGKGLGPGAGSPTLPRSGTFFRGVQESKFECPHCYEGIFVEVGVWSTFISGVSLLALQTPGKWPFVCTCGQCPALMRGGATEKEAALSPLSLCFCSRLLRGPLVSWGRGDGEQPSVTGFRVSQQVPCTRLAALNARVKNHRDPLIPAAS